MTATRRDLLKLISALPLTPFLAKPAGAAIPKPTNAPIPGPTSCGFLLNRFSIAGFQYSDGPALMHRLGPPRHIDQPLPAGCFLTCEPMAPAVAPGLQAGAQLKLTREPRNPHDPFAVEIHLGKAKLGYVPRSDNKYLSRLLEQGARLECRVVEVDAGAGV